MRRTGSSAGPADAGGGGALGAAIDVTSTLALGAGEGAGAAGTDGLAGPLQADSATNAGSHQRSAKSDMTPFIQRNARGAERGVQATRRRRVYHRGKAWTASTRP